MLRRNTVIGAILMTSVLCGVLIAISRAKEERPKKYSIRVVKEYPHDPAAFCQGLAIESGVLYESTGLYGQSSLRTSNLETGRLLQRRLLAKDVFGEGLTIANGRIYQLTWKAGLCYVYDPETLKHISTLSYPGQGWGLSFDGRCFYMSDGSARIRVLNSKTFRLERIIRVTDEQKPIRNLNELECIRGMIYANVWQSDQVAEIDSKTGKVTAWIDLSRLALNNRKSKDDVLNGIAYDSEGERLFVTGKNWSKLFEIELLKN